MWSLLFSNIALKIYNSEWYTSTVVLNVLMRSSALWEYFDLRHSEDQDDFDELLSKKLLDAFYSSFSMEENPADRWTNQNRILVQEGVVKWMTVSRWKNRYVDLCGCHTSPEQSRWRRAVEAAIQISHVGNAQKIQLHFYACFLGSPPVPLLPCPAVFKIISLLAIPFSWAL